ncbi:MAG: dipeptide epimerase [Roseiflexaceae bacterium]|nr:dipeptide epimerase [Roseiflexaceae bacterium]
MTIPTTIRSLHVTSLDIPLREPFGIAGGAQDVACNLLITVELADGTRGYGEAAPFPAFNGETQETTRTAILAAQSVVEGADVREWRRIALALPAIPGMTGAARCAIETALIDALTRRARLPLWSFFGGTATALETDVTVTTGSIAAAARAAREIVARGVTTIKIKIGAGNPETTTICTMEHDLARIIAVRDAAPDARLILDGNCSYTADDALSLLDMLNAHGIVPVLFEQPVAKDDETGLRRLTAAHRVPIAADESAASAADVARLAQTGAVDVINIKLMKCGIVEALDIAAVARVAGLRLMIGGMVESILAMTVSACFAAGQGGFTFVDLDTPLFLAENPFEGGMIYRGGMIDLRSIDAGHGVTPL